MSLLLLFSLAYGGSSMAVLFADRVKVNTATTGTGTINLGTAVSGYRTFATAASAGSLTSGCTVYYVIEDGANWETGSGTYTAGSPDTLSRTVAASSAGGTTAISLSGSAIVYIATTTQSIYSAIITGGTIDGSVIGGTTPAAGTFTTANFGSSTGAKINLFSTTYGFGIASFELTVFVPSAGAVIYRPGYGSGTSWGQIDSTGLNAMPVGATTASTGAFTTITS